MNKFLFVWCDALTCVSKGFLCMNSSVIVPLEDDVTKGWPGGLLWPVGLGLFFK